MIPLQPSYGSYLVAPQGECGFGSLNDALRSPTTALHGHGGTMASSGGGGSGGGGGLGVPQTPREVKAKRRESAMVFINSSQGGSF